MDFFEFKEQYTYSREQETKEQLWSLWANLYPNFDKENFVSFPQFVEQMTGKTANNKKISSNGKSDEELITEAQEILFKMEFVEKQ